MPTDTTITRYHIEPLAGTVMRTQHVDGAWVRYEDHEHALTVAHAARDVLAHYASMDPHMPIPGGLTRRELQAAVVQQMARADVMARQARDLRAQLTTALRERDEARQELARYQAEHSKRRP